MVSYNGNRLSVSVEVVVAAAAPHAIVALLAEDFCRQVDGYRNPRGGRFQSGMYSVHHHASRGELTGALPSGRRAGLALANALRKLQMGAQAVPMTEATPATSHMFIVNPLTGGSMLKLFSTHPPMEERVARLELMASGQR